MFPRRNDSVTGRGVYIQTFESYNQAEKEATRAPTDLLDLATIMALTAILNQIEAQRDHGYSSKRFSTWLALDRGPRPSSEMR